MRKDRIRVLRAAAAVTLGVGIAAALAAGATVGKGAGWPDGTHQNSNAGGAPYDRHLYPNY